VVVVVVMTSPVSSILCASARNYTVVCICTQYRLGWTDG
jgi:hypothetical protein